MNSNNPWTEENLEPIPPSFKKFGGKLISLKLMRKFPIQPTTYDPVEKRVKVKDFGDYYSRLGSEMDE